jgi:phasin family protein
MLEIPIPRSYLLHRSIEGAPNVADQTITKVTETKADVLPKADAPKALAAEPAKAAPAKIEAARAEPVKTAAPAAPKAETPVKAAPKTIKAAKPVKKTPAKRKPAARKAKAKPARKPIARIVKPARAGAKAIKTGVTIMNKQTNKAAQTAQIAADQIRNVFGDVNARAQTAMEKNAKIVEEFAELTRGNVEALVASSKVAAKGVEGMSQHAAEYGRKTFEGATAAFRSFADVKSATDFFKLQGDFARSAFDSAVAESARVSETVLKLAGDVAEPLTSRYTVAAERVKTLAA